MRLALYVLTVIIVSCNTLNKERDQQNKIDSLINELRRRDSEAANEITARKEKPENSPVPERKERQAKQEKNPVKKDEQETDVFLDQRNAVLSKVIIGKPSFRPLTFGGFKDIRFDFFNNYNYKLEEAIVKVHYIRADGSEIKSETRILKDISPNVRLALTAPDYAAAGREIKITLEAVHCESIGLCFYSMYSVKPGDPYKCK